MNGLLTTVGGYNSHSDSNSNKLFSLKGEGRGRKWTEVFPPMSKRRYRAVAVTTGRALIVAGGRGRGGVLSTVEIMNTDTRQWSTAANLPQPLSIASATVCGDRIYMSEEKSVITCFLPALLQSCCPTFLEANPFTPSTQGPVWSTLTDLPVEQSTLVSIDNHLLAIGGRDSDNVTTAVHLYNPVINSWQIISNLRTPRRSCLAVVLPDSRIMVVGGLTTQSLTSETDKVEFTTAEQV